MPKEIEINVRAKTDQAKKGFDGLNVSAKDLQTRLADLDKQMEKLLATQGKQAYQSVQGQRITRERTAALNQLIIMEEKNVTATRMSTRGLGSLASATIAATGSMSGLGTGISVLTNALMSGAGLTAGLAAAVAGFSLLMEYLRNTNAEFDALKGQITGLTEVKLPEGSFKINPEKIPAFIDKIKSSYQDLAHSEKYLYDLLPKGGGDFEKKSEQTVQNFQALVESLQETYNKYVNMKNMIKEFGDMGLNWTEKIKEQNKELSKQEEHLYSIWKMMMRPKKGTGEDWEARKKLDYDVWKSIMRPTKPGLAPQGTEVEKMQKQREQDMQQFAQTSASIFTSNMNQAWESIFGEANSMFEQMLSSWQSMLFEKIGFGIFNMLFGGIDLFGFARNLTAGNATSTKYRMGG